MTADSPPGLDTVALTRWLAGRDVDVVPPLRAEIIAGGRSNLTYRILDSRGVPSVLRRPPLSGALPTAHDMAREARVLRALADSPVPVPAVLAMCDDATVIGAPFLLMSFVDGAVVRTRADAVRRLSVPARAAVAENLAGILATLHSLDPAAIGLDGRERGAGFVERQLRRWLRQWEDGGGDLDVDTVRSLHEELTRRLPKHRQAALIHGDFRLDNAVVDDSGRVLAILDWELSTVGDPGTDVGVMLAYWTDTPDEIGAMVSAPSLAPGFPSRASLYERYQKASVAADVDLDFYVAFALWRNAVILQTVHTRYLAGAYGTVDGEVATMPTRARGCLELARRALDGSLMTGD